MKKSKIHYAWWILAGCCALQGGTLGIINNCAGLFFSPISAELGFDMGSLTFYRTLCALASCCGMPFVGKLLRKYDVRIILSVCTLILGGSTMLMSRFTQLWHWYIAGILQGFAGAFLVLLPAPIILSNWFLKKTGTVIGISAASSGILGIGASYLLGRLIPLVGWRASLMANGAMALILVLPFTLFVLRYSPREKNVTAYGDDDGCHAAQPFVPALKLSSFIRQPLFYRFILLDAFIFFVSGFYQLISAHGISIGLSLSAAGLMTSLALAGNTAAKFVQGKMTDLFGVKPTFMVSMLVSCVGFALLLTGKAAGAYMGAFLYGVVLPVGSVMMPLLIRTQWGNANYGAALSYITMAGSLLAAPGVTLFGYLYDRTASYGSSLIICSMIACGILILIASFREEKQAKPVEGLNTTKTFPAGLKKSKE